MSKRNKIFLIVGAIIGFGLILLWLRYIPLNEVKMYFKQIIPIYVVLAVVTYLLAYFVRSYRWNLILRQNITLPVRDTWLYAMGGNLVNYIIPIRAGELVKAWFIKKNHQMAMSQTLASVFIDKTFDTLAIISVIVLIPFLAIKLNMGLSILLMLLILVFVISVGALLLAAWRKDLILKYLVLLIRLFPKRFQTRLEGTINNFVEGLNLLEHRPRILLGAVLLTGLGILLDGLYFFLMFKAFGIQFSFIMVLFGYTLINMSYALPQPPAQLGSNEWMMIIIFSMGFSLTKSSASAIMAFSHILTAILMGLVGSIAFAVSGYEVVQMIIKGEKIDG